VFVWLHQPAVLFSQNKPVISNQQAILFSQNKPAPTISHQPNEHAAGSEVPHLSWAVLVSKKVFKLMLNTN
jgi:hypothetical protein